MTVQTQEHEARWGALTLAGDAPTGTTWQIDTMADGSNFGAAEPIIEELRSILDGAAEAVVTGVSRREFSLRLRVTAPDGESLAEGEAALFGECLLPGRRTALNPIVWVPPLAMSAPIVFDLVTAWLYPDTSDGWDYAEVARSEAFYRVEFTSVAFPRSIDSVVVPAIGVPPAPGMETTVLIDDMDATTGWSVTGSGGASVDPVSSSSGHLVVEGSVSPGSSGLVMLERSGATSMTDTPYLRADVKVIDSAATGSPAANFDGGTEQNPVATQTIADGWVRYWFEAPASFTTVQLTLRVRSYTVFADEFEFHYDNLYRTDTLGDPTTSTNRQQSRLATINGAAPTQAVVRMWSDSGAALVPSGCDVLVHISSNTSWDPRLRPFLDTSAAVTADAADVSGGHQDFTSPTVYRIPANALRTGTYHLAALLDTGAIGSDALVTWTAKMVDLDTGADVIGSTVVTSGTALVPNDNDNCVRALGDIPLPVVDTEGSNYAVELTLTSDRSALVLDEAWLLGLDDGALTHIHDPDGLLSWIEIRSAEFGAQESAVWGGTGALGNQPVNLAFMTRSKVPAEFRPGTVQVFTVCAGNGGALDSQSEVEYYPRGLHRILAAWTAA